VSTPFDPNSGLIVIRAVLWGPAGSLALVLALDTGATRTTIAHAPLLSLGYNPAASANSIQVTMGGSVEYSPVVQVDRIDALGHSRSAMEVLAHTLPPSAGIDGLLGLDFIRNQRLTIDFTTGRIDLT
jgi:hypothetical protein